MSIRDDQGGWTFLTNHGHVLLALARDPDARLREVAASVGITERAVQAIVADLEAGGYLTRDRVGRRNRYTLDPDQAFRHPAEQEHRIGELLLIFGEMPHGAPGGLGRTCPGHAHGAGSGGCPEGDPVRGQSGGTAYG